MSRYALPCLLGGLVALLALPAFAQEDDIEWEEEDASAPLKETLRGLDPALPCIVAETEIVPMFEAKTVRVALATEGCDASVTRDPGPSAPADTAAFARIVEIAAKFAADQSISGVTRYRVEYAALGWMVEVDAATWKDTDGLPPGKLAAAATWSGIDAGTVVHAPPDLLARREEDGRELNAETIAEVIRSNVSSLRYCQQSRIVMDTGERPRGEARIRMTIDGKGVVQSPEVVSSTFTDPEVDACLVERFTQMVFPESTTGEEFDITWPVKLD